MSPCYYCGSKHHNIRQCNVDWRDFLWWDGMFDHEVGYMGEINCNNLQIRDIGYETFKYNMGYGKNFYSGKPKKNWKNTQQGTSVHFLNKILCDRVHSKILK